MAVPHRIDTQHHILPPRYVAEVGEAEAGEAPVEHPSGVVHLAVAHEMESAGDHVSKCTDRMPVPILGPRSPAPSGRGRGGGGGPVEGGAPVKA